ncbi:MAG TPA: ASKHA domain-containing protein [Thermoleophilia bacterium]|nr:ASKHA domain-containing protein [Thermoleophilia bacterium]
MTKVFVEPIGVTVEIPDGETLLAVVTSGAVDVPVDCAGRGTCGKCLVRTGAGSFSEPNEIERGKVPASKLAQGWRLACQVTPLSERVSIEVRATQGRRQILTTSRLHPGEPHPAVVREVVALEPPTLADARADRERLLAAVGGADLPLGVLRQLPATLRDGGYRVMVTRYEGRPVDVEPADAADPAYGVAVDVGTSKIIAYLFDLTSGRLIDQEALENPQMRFGEDVVTRLTQAIHDGRSDDLRRAARGGINELLATLCARQTIAPRHLYDMTVVGNTAMHHLALGISAVGLGGAPFAPALAAPVTLRAAELGFAMNPEAGVHFPPPIAGFVGSDCLAVIAATRLAESAAPRLAIDIGTNTEIALVHEGKVVVTSCASGPAFEGYQIACGLKAVEGAIERVTIGPDGEPGELRTIGGREPLGICGSGVVDLLAGLVAAGVVDAGGRLQPHPRVRANGRGPGLEYLLATGPQGEIVFTQHDVRSLQLAKAAIASGAKLLLANAGLEAAALEQVLVAGAFGNELDVDNALAIGLLPAVPRERVAFVGNAAGVGAQMALIDIDERRAMAALAGGLAFLDLATDREFHEVFTGELGFA